MPHLFSRLALVTWWSRSSAEGARRNAMTATTDCARRRAEHDEVAAYIRTCLAGRRAG